MNDDVKNPSPLRGFADQAAEVTSDILELAELQVGLTKADVVLAAKVAKFPFIFLVIGACTSVAALPVLMLGLTGWLSANSNLLPWHSQLIIGGAFMLLAVIAILLSFHGLVRAIGIFQRSTDELSKNVAWLKTIFRGA
ncbi:MAG: phage holin family protein [Pirellulaceae bacterium]|nr:phage holin family protein [Pirellulaceae bacterium]